MPGLFDGTPLQRPVTCEHCGLTHGKCTCPRNTDGKVALVDSVAALGAFSGCFDPAVIDFVGYGTATCFEGGLAGPATSNAVAAVRRGGGCQDGNQNVADFQVLTPTPRNSATRLPSARFSGRAPT